MMMMMKTVMPTSALIRREGEGKYDGGGDIEEDDTIC